MLLGLSQPVMSTDIQRLAENLCEYAQTDNRSSMRKKLKGARMRLKAIYPGLLCNGNTLLQVATKSGSINSAKFIVTKAGKKILLEEDIIGYTQKLIDSGDVSKQEFLDLYVSKLND